MSTKGKAIRVNDDDEVFIRARCFWLKVNAKLAAVGQRRKAHFVKIEVGLNLKDWHFPPRRPELVLPKMHRAHLAAESSRRPSRRWGQALFMHRCRRHLPRFLASLRFSDGARYWSGESRDHAERGRAQGADGGLRRSPGTTLDRCP